MRTLTVADYEYAEKEAMSRLPNVLIEAMQPLTFEKLGYPTRVRREAELVKYFDVMHEQMFEPRFTQILEKLTPAEFDSLQRLLGVTSRFSEYAFQKLYVPRGTLVQSLSVLRHIKFLFGESRPRIFELGAGSGYLGALLLLDGYPFASMDVAQAFYLYQNHLWHFAANGNLFEGAIAGGTQSALMNIPNGHGVHVPWWDFASMTTDSAPQFDILTCNHMLCEMHDCCLRLALILARAFLRGAPNEKKAIVFEGWGYSDLGKRTHVTQRFVEAGFTLVHHDLKIAVFAPSDSAFAQNGLQLPATYVKPTAFMQGNGQLVVEQVHEHSFVPQFCENSENPLSNLILEGRRQMQDRMSIGFEQLQAVMTALLGNSDHRTDNEKFWDLIGIKNQIGAANQ